MANLPEKTASEIEPPEPFATKALRWTAYPISAIAGGLAAHVSMRNSIFARIKKYNGLNGIIEEHTNDFKVLKGTPHDVVADISRINTKYKSQINARMKEWGFNHTLDFWKGCHDTEKLEAALLFGTVGGIFLGVMLTLADNKSLQHFFSKKEKNEDQKIAI